MQFHILSCQLSDTLIVVLKKIERLISRLMIISPDMHCKVVFKLVLAF